MRVSDFYGSLACKKASEIKKAKEHGYITCIYEAISLMGDMLLNKMPLEAIKKRLSNHLSYKDEWFEDSWQKSFYENRDFSVFMRFLTWLKTKKLAEGWEIIHSNFPVEAEGLSTNVNLIMKKRENDLFLYEAIVMRFSKSKISYGGKSLLTNVSTRLELLVPKMALEKSYPNIRVSYITLMNGLDTEESLTPDFLELTTQKSNYFWTDFSELKNGSIFSFDKAKQVISNVLSVKKEPECFMCSEKAACQLKNLKECVVLPALEEHGIPGFTEEQTKAVHHKDGALLICAGPGSGKTAVLVGRAKELVKQGVPKQDILLLTFTNKAVGEARRRLGEGFMVQTFHSYACQILVEQSEKLGKKIKPLTDTEKLKVLNHLLQSFPKMRGFSYQKKWGKNGLLDRVALLMEEFFADVENFSDKYPLIDEVFPSFCFTAKKYFEAEGFVLFDEQIILATKLLQEDEGVKKLYSSPYIMVDEFQDIDEEQCLFIDTLAETYGNICVVGDDDQDIYSFRGGSNYFFRTFPDRYPNCEKITLQRNFRSAPCIVRSSRALIEKNKERFEKNYRSERPDLGAVIKTDKDTSLNDCVSCLLKEGFNYGDIAIISRTNADLERIGRSNEFPCHLEKELLIYSSLFVTVRKMLSISCAKEKIGAESHYIFSKTLGLDALEIESLISLIRNSEYENFFNNLMISLKSCLGITEDFVFAGEDELRSLTEGYQDIAPLLEQMDCMAKAEDDTRLCTRKKDEISLITAHDSKGKEFKAVII